MSLQWPVCDQELIPDIKEIRVNSQATLTLFSWTDKRSLCRFTLVKCQKGTWPCPFIKCQQPVFFIETQPWIPMIETDTCWYQTFFSIFPWYVYQNLLNTKTSQTLSDWNSGVTYYLLFFCGFITICNWDAQMHSLRWQLPSVFRLFFPSKHYRGFQCLYDFGSKAL